MASQEIQLHYNQGEYPDLTFSCNEIYTARDLREEVAEMQGIEPEDVTLYQTFLKIDDETLVRDLQENENKKVVSYSLQPNVGVESNDDIWTVRNGKWNLLLKDTEDFLDVGKKRNFLRSGSSFGELAFVRNRYVIVVTKWG